ncbi:hypothetical protein CALCODRAFT_189639 [Calocera cornea HHB12733]|uniref:Micro-fibrillar-associated protein 1 C-terminal domain-containing protein n=1 Tax=Calocera cornea HHB12733 TaxID=1353952 RepID=A0A165C8Q4_9BASI|nr:hypothetical protein CALCODRAFT_189639 [Calocera cornea HHB12733]
MSWLWTHRLRSGAPRRERRSGSGLGGRRSCRGGTLMEAEAESDEEEEEADEDEDEGEEESSEEESEEEAPQPKIMFRPVFVPKRGRETIQELEQESQNSEEALRKREKEEEERRKLSKALVAESIKRELAEKDATELVPDVDDTDGLDPEAEFEAWRLRELERIKRDKEEQLEREREREEVERRRAMPEEQRLKEDLERAKKLREEKPKGQQKFLQKYWHKGAFHQDSEVLKRHDYTEATESTVDVSVLPKVMQVKNFGKRSQTKYTHLLDQDTTVGNGGFGGAPSKSKSGPMGQNGQGSGCFVCGGPHLKKDCPQLARGGPETSGANSREVGPSKWGASRDRDDRQQDRRPNDDRDPTRERYRERYREGEQGRDRAAGRRSDDRGFRRSRSRSGSFSPPRRREDDYRGRDERERDPGARDAYRRRDRSREDLDRERERDKRRRVY